MVGFEPTACSLRKSCSTSEPHRQTEHTTLYYGMTQADWQGKFGYYKGNSANFV